MVPRSIHHTLTFGTSSDTDIIDITGEVLVKVRESGCRDGVVTLFVPGSTGALTTIEFESGVINDLRCAVERMASRDLEYEHDRRWGDGNGYSHVRAALMGPSLSIPLISGKLTLGTWQQIVLLDFDNRPRQKKSHPTNHGSRTAPGGTLIRGASTPNARIHVAIRVSSPERRFYRMRYRQDSGKAKT